MFLKKKKKTLSLYVLESSDYKGWASSNTSFVWMLQAISTVVTDSFAQTAKLEEADFRNLSLVLPHWKSPKVI